MNTECYNKYVQILKEELVPAMGCTEPIAIAYATAYARDVLKEKAQKIEVLASGNMIKNTKCVIVPNTGNLVGIEASAIIGLLAGDSEKELEVISVVNEEAISETSELLKTDFCNVDLLDTTNVLHFIIKLYGENHSCSVEITNAHTHIQKVILDDKVVYEDNETNKYLGKFTDRSCLNIDDIYEFANTCDLNDVRDLIERQIECNIAIANEGMGGQYGIGIGQCIFNEYTNDIISKVKAYTAAASEARMSGCCLPVVTNSGSGNQGITCSVPLIIYARNFNYDEEKLLRTLVFSNLTAIHQKTSIGRLSAFCGAVSAACAAGAGFTYLKDGNLTQIKDTITNTLADIPGIVCDGAKATCAAKIATSLDAAIMSHQMAMKNKVYDGHMGILKHDIENTIQSIGRIGKYGMKSTDKEILDIMLDKER